MAAVGNATGEHRPCDQPQHRNPGTCHLARDPLHHPRHGVVQQGRERQQHDEDQVQATVQGPQRQRQRGEPREAGAVHDHLAGRVHVEGKRRHGV